MSYSPPAGNITDTVGIFQWINTVTENWFFPGLIFSVYIIILVKLMFSTDDKGKSFAAASFVCMIISVLMRVANLVDTSFMIIFIILTAVSAVWMMVDNSDP